jgi:hypothetical protein
MNTFELASLHDKQFLIYQQNKDIKVHSAAASHAAIIHGWSTLICLALCKNKASFCKLEPIKIIV